MLNIYISILKCKSKGTLGCRSWVLYLFMRGPSLYCAASWLKEQGVLEALGAVPRRDESLAERTPRLHQLCMAGGVVQDRDLVCSNMWMDMQLLIYGNF